jgi:hypothetical protein
MAELLFAAAPRLDPDELLRRVNQTMPETTLTPQSEKAWVFGHNALRHTYDDGHTAPLLTSLFFATSDPGTTARDLSQSWEWPDAQSVLAGCTHTVLVTEMLASGPHRPAVRIGAFRTVLDAVIELAWPAATWWPVSGQALPADDPLAEHPLRGLVNVRRFRVENDPGVSLMDTLGMAPFGLPDLQCHFRDIDPGKVGAKLFNTAAYLVENGPVIDSGHTVGGIDPDQVWRAQWEDALVRPHRPVIDLDPGDPYAAGGRHR